MLSFQTELDNPLVQRDILELEKKIKRFRDGTLDEERFRSLRLARGIYGQRQEGVQMIRIKLPYGKVSGDQLLRICDVSEKYSTGRLHITTRQDIQIHFVSLDRTPELWAELEASDVTLREACGNTVRNVTASEFAGIDPEEPFDITPYADAVFRYFLRNPICQEMGRKFKIAFSSSERDTGLTFMHDLGFIPLIKVELGQEIRGFRVLIGGGLGSQSRQADVAHEFLKTDEIIPFTEGVLRIFDRYGERNRRMKARIKFLIQDMGLEKFLHLVEEERAALSHQSVEIKPSGFEPVLPKSWPGISIDGVDQKAFAEWKKHNVFAQKQEGYFAIGVKVRIGDLFTPEARQLARLISDFAGDEIRLTLRQNLQIRHVPEAALPFFYSELGKLGLADLGYNSMLDITACPGTDTCNLGISNSTGIAKELERVLAEEYPQYLNEREMTIKISGCMNSCGQHMMAHIGFQGMTIKSGANVAPALQVLLGGGTVGNGVGRFADKVIKVPSRRAPQALRTVLNDFNEHGESKNFLDYYDGRGSKYFYDMLKPLGESENITDAELIDWGGEGRYKMAIGVGECAGVMVDLVSTLFLETDEKLELADESYAAGRWADAIYLGYAALVNVAKALLLDRNEQANTQDNIIAKFDEVFASEAVLELPEGISKIIYAIQENEPTESFAKAYIAQAKMVSQRIIAFRNTK